MISIEEMKREMEESTPVGDDLTMEDYIRLGEMVTSHGMQGLFYAIGIAYNNGFRDGMKGAKKK